MKLLDKEARASSALPVAAAAGDEAAFAAIVRRMTPLMRAQMRQFFYLQADEEDLMQECLMGLLAAVRTFHSQSNTAFTTYACSCMRNRLISLARRDGLRPRIEQSLEEDTQMSDADDADPASRVVEQEAADSLRQQLRQRLTELEYEVLLARINDFSYEEIAAALGVSKKAVDNAVQRLRRKMSG